MKNTSQIFGIHAVMEAIKSGKTIDKVFLQKGLQGELSKELISLLRSKAISPNTVPVEKLNRITTKNHQGVIAFTSPVDFYDLEELLISTQEKGEIPLFILLDQLTDARNFGAIIRTAECVGAHGIVVTQSGSAPVSEDTVKTSAGAVYNVPICKVNHLKDAIFLLKSYGVQTVAATEKTTEDLYVVNFALPSAIVMGSEGKGVSSGILKAVDKKVKLPMFGKISSLNVSVAAGAFLYEAIRQRSL